MTGMHTGHAYIRGNRSEKPEGQAPLPVAAVTMSGLLKQSGYSTGMFGKWGLGGPDSTGDPMDQGFDEFFGYKCQSLAHNYYPDYLWHNRDKVMLDGKTYSHDLIMDKAFEFIRTHKNGPFFCYLPVTIPHASLHVPEESARPFRKKFKRFELTPGFYAGPIIRNPAACFAGMMTRLDRQIGGLLDLLKNLGIDENTMIMFSSDNGPHKEGGHMPGFFNSSGGFKGGKRDLYEGGIRVPMLARWPGKISPGSVTDHVSAFWDVMPTICEAAGISTLGNIDGLSFLPAMQGRVQEQKQHKFLYWEFHERGGKQAVRMGRWKAVKRYVSINKDAAIELYDLESDPGETADMAKSRPDIIRRVEEIFASARTPSPDFRLLPYE